MSSSLITAHDVSVGISDCHIVRDVKVNLLPGKTLVIMGPNGSGKSTLLKALTGLEEGSMKVSFSKLLIKDKSLDSLSFKERSLLWTLVPQFPEWQRGLRVSEYLEFARYPYFSLSTIKESDSQLVTDIVNGLCISGLLSKNLEHLSGGERKKVAIAAALYQDVPLVYLDEPFQALDPLAKMELAQFLKTWQRKKGVSYIMASHDFFWSYELCDDVLFLQRGEPKFYGVKEDVFTKENLEVVYSVPFKWVDLTDNEGFFAPIKGESKGE